MATRKTSKKFKVIMDPELSHALKGFVPVFGSAQDLDIVTRVLDLSKQLESVDNDILRYGDKKHTGKMKNILFMEDSLKREINKRNLDF